MSYLDQHRVGLGKVSAYVLVRLWQGIVVIAIGHLFGGGHLVLELDLLISWKVPYVDSFGAGQSNVELWLSRRPSHTFNRI